MTKNSYKKNILVIATTFPRWHNDSTPSFVYELSERLGKSYNISVLAPHHYGAKKNEKMGSVQVKRFAYFWPERLQRLCYGAGIIPNMKSSMLAFFQFPLLIFSEFVNSWKIIRREKIDLIHAHWMLPQGIIGAVLKKIFGKPLMVTIHGSDLFPLKNLFFRKLQEFTVKNADIVTINSPAAKKELLDRFSIYEEKIFLIPMGINTKLFRNKNRKNNGKAKKILFVGRLNDQKGLDYLIIAMRKISKKEPNARLLIIGEGEYKSYLHQLAGNEEVSDRVEFMGAKPHNELVHYYQSCDILVLPSLSNKTGTESLGLVLIEGMACGLPVVGTRVGGIPSIINNRENGILVEQKNSDELADAINFLLDHPKESKRMGINASNFARNNFSWDKVSGQFNELYSELLR